MGESQRGQRLDVVKGIAIKTSDNALLSLLKRIKTTDDPAKINWLSDQLERVIFRKKFDTA